MSFSVNYFTCTSQVDERIDELESLEADFLDAQEKHTEAVEGFYGASKEEIEELHEHLLKMSLYFDANDRDELNQLRAFRDELEGYCDWDHGDSLIHKDYRIDYARELAGDLPEHWPFNHIDWDQAVEELFEHDFTYADYDGDTYYVRCS